VKELFRVFTIADTASKEEKKALLRVAFRRFLRSRTFALLFCSIVGILLYRMPVRLAVKLENNNGNSLYLAKSTYQSVCRTIAADFQADLGSALVINIETQSVLTFSSQLTEDNPVEKLLHFLGDPYAYREVYSLGGKTLCAVLPEECDQAEAIIAQAMEDTLSLFSNAAVVSIEGTLTHSQKIVAQKNFTDLNTLYDTLMNFSGQEYYTLKAGETGFTVAEVWDISTAQLTVLNPDKPLEEYGEGDRLMLCMGQNAFSVYASYDAVYQTVLPYGTETKGTRTLLIGESLVETEGINGMALVIARVGTLNGKIFNVWESCRETVTEVQTEVVLQGTRVDDGMMFYAPVDSTNISSYFGYRTLRGERNYHKGVDYAVPVGTEVYAAADGVVTKCGVFGNGNYGKCVVIDHGNGFLTYYAHNSKLLVSVGDTVVKGELIARSGNTGNSTGPHCHFEVRKNGTAVNPFQYMTKP